MSDFDVTIAGEINLDLILYGLPATMPFERELLANQFQVTLGSSSAILAYNLAAMGMRVGFITMVGQDELGKIALERLAEAGVDLSHMLVSDRGTSTGVTVLLPHGDVRHILTYPGTMAEMDGKSIDIDYLARGRHFHISSLSLQKGLQPELPVICRRLKQAGLTISLDTNDDPEDKWDGVLDELLDLVDVLLPNHDEILRITGTNNLDDALAALSSRIPVIAVKCGSSNSIVQARKQRFVVPSLHVTPVDTIGAGDSFNAGFLKGYLEDLPLDRCAAMGNAAAALSLLGPGGTEAYRDRKQMRAFLQKHGVTL
jgi:sugar/nucleoside kinase (ribokinase family)